MSKVKPKLKKRFGFGSNREPAPPSEHDSEIDGIFASVKIIRPTSQQLQLAVQGALDTYKNARLDNGDDLAEQAPVPTVNEIRKIIGSQYPNWRVSERRAKKHLGRALRNGDGPPRGVRMMGSSRSVSGDSTSNCDDSISTVSTVSYIPSPRAVLRRVFHRQRKPKNLTGVVIGGGHVSPRPQYGPENRPRSQRFTGADSPLTPNRYGSPKRHGSPRMQGSPRTFDYAHTSPGMHKSPLRVNTTKLSPQGAPHPPPTDAMDAMDRATGFASPAASISRMQDLEVDVIEEEENREEERDEEEERKISALSLPQMLGAGIATAAMMRTGADVMVDEESEKAEEHDDDQDQDEEGHGVRSDIHLADLKEEEEWQGNSTEMVQEASTHQDAEHVMKLDRMPAEEELSEQNTEQLTKPQPLVSDPAADLDARPEDLDAVDAKLDLVVEQAPSLVAEPAEANDAQADATLASRSVSQTTSDIEFEVDEDENEADDAEPQPEEAAVVAPAAIVKLDPEHISQTEATSESLAETERLSNPAQDEEQEDQGQEKEQAPDAATAPADHLAALAMFHSEDNDEEQQHADSGPYNEAAIEPILAKDLQAAATTTLQQQDQNDDDSSGTQYDADETTVLETQPASDSFQVVSGVPPVTDTEQTAESAADPDASSEADTMMTAGSEQAGGEDEEPEPDVLGMDQSFDTDAVMSESTPVPVPDQQETPTEPDTESRADPLEAAVSAATTMYDLAPSEEEQDIALQEMVDEDSELEDGGGAQAGAEPAEERPEKVLGHEIKSLALPDPAAAAVAGEDQQEDEEDEQQEEEEGPEEVPEPSVSMQSAYVNASLDEDEEQQEEEEEPEEVPEPSVSMQSAFVNASLDEDDEQQEDEDGPEEGPEPSVSMQSAFVSASLDEDEEQLEDEDEPEEAPEPSISTQSAFVSASIDEDENDDEDKEDEASMDDADIVSENGSQQDADELIELESHAVEREAETNIIIDQVIMPDREELSVFVDGMESDEVPDEDDDLVEEFASAHMSSFQPPFAPKQASDLATISARDEADETLHSTTFRQVETDLEQDADLESMMKSQHDNESIATSGTEQDAEMFASSHQVPARGSNPITITDLLGHADEVDSEPELEPEHSWENMILRNDIESYDDGSIEGHEPEEEEDYFTDSGAVIGAATALAAGAAIIQEHDADDVTTGSDLQNEADIDSSRDLLVGASQRDSMQGSITMREFDVSSEPAVRDPVFADQDLDEEPMEEFDDTIKTSAATTAVLELASSAELDSGRALGAEGHLEDAVDSDEDEDEAESITGQPGLAQDSISWAQPQDDEILAAETMLTRNLSQHSETPSAVEGEEVPQPERLSKSEAEAEAEEIPDDELEDDVEAAAKVYDKTEVAADGELGEQPASFTQPETVAVTESEVAIAACMPQAPEVDQEAECVDEQQGDVLQRELFDHGEDSGPELEGELEPSSSIEIFEDAESDIGQDIKDDANGDDDATEMEAATSQVDEGLESQPVLDADTVPSGEDERRPVVNEEGAVPMALQDAPLAVKSDEDEDEATIRDSDDKQNDDVAGLEKHANTAALIGVAAVAATGAAVLDTTDDQREEGNVEESELEPKLKEHPNQEAIDSIMLLDSATPADNEDNDDSVSPASASSLMRDTWPGDECMDMPNGAMQHSADPLPDNRENDVDGEADDDDDVSEDSVAEAEQLTAIVDALKSEPSVSSEGPDDRDAEVDSKSTETFQSSQMLETGHDTDAAQIIDATARALDLPEEIRPCQDVEADSLEDFVSAAESEPEDDAESPTAPVPTEDARSDNGTDEFAPQETKQPDVEREDESEPEVEQEVKMPALKVARTEEDEEAALERALMLLESLAQDTDADMPAAESAAVDSTGEEEHEEAALERGLLLLQTFSQEEDMPQAQTIASSSEEDQGGEEHEEAALERGLLLLQSFTQEEDMPQAQTIASSSEEDEGDEEMELARVLERGASLEASEQPMKASTPTSQDKSIVRDHTGVGQDANGEAEVDEDEDQDATSETASAADAPNREERERASSIIAEMAALVMDTEATIQPASKAPTDDAHDADGSGDDASIINEDKQIVTEASMTRDVHQTDRAINAYDYHDDTEAFISRPGKGECFGAPCQIM